MKPETCGYCRGTGRVPGRRYDHAGRYRPEWPEQVACEYCYGAGRIEDGSKLLPARTREQLEPDERDRLRPGSFE